MSRPPRNALIFALLAFVLAALLTRGVVSRPTYTDAYYYFNAAERLASGDGLTDTYLWTYIGAPDEIGDDGTFPAHLYWMPFTSLAAAAGMWLAGSPGSFAAAQWPFTLMLLGAACVGFWLGGRVNGTRRGMWLAGLLTLFSGFFVSRWGMTETFTPFAFFGSLALVWMSVRETPPPNPLPSSGEGASESGLEEMAASSQVVDSEWMTTPPPNPLPAGAERGSSESGLEEMAASSPMREHNSHQNSRESSFPLSIRMGRGSGGGFFLLAGIFSGFGHLIRADGLLLLMVAAAVIWWPWDVPRFKRRLIATVLLLIGYALVMLPWALRNLDEIGTILPVGGAQSMWFTRYDDLFNFPPDATLGSFFADGLGVLVSSRWTAFTNALGTFVAVEGLVVMAPLMLVGLWRRRQDRFLRGFWVYALGLHLAMIVVFPFPGYRGGLFHSAAALVPWWSALGAAGLDDTVDWIARRRRRWRPGTAKWVFSGGLLVMAVALSLWNIKQMDDGRAVPAMYTELVETLPEDARVMINDPAALYYFTGLGGVVIANEDPAVVPQIAAAYDINYLLVERQGEALAVPIRFDFDPQHPPDFLTPVAFEHGYLYVIERQTSS